MDPESVAERLYHKKTGTKLFTKYQEEGNPTDLSDAIVHRHKALDLCPPGDLIRSSYLNSLAKAIVAWYEREGNLDDLSRAIQYYQEALDLLPSGHDNRSIAASSLGGTLQSRYEREGEVDDLVHAIRYQEEALELRPLGHSSRASSLINLANSILYRYKLRGNLVDLVRAIQYLQEALDLRPPGHPSRSTPLGNLAAALQMRYEREDNPLDLSKAIQYLQEALELCPPNRPGRSTYLNNLGSAIWTQFEREGDLRDLTNAIRYLREALDLRPPGNPDRLSALTNLAGAIQARYKRTGDLDDLALATQYHEDTLRLRPLEHPDRPVTLKNLANLLETRYELEKDLDYITRAVQHLQEAVDLRPSGHPDRSTSLRRLAKALHTQLTGSGSLQGAAKAAAYDVGNVPDSSSKGEPGDRSRIIALLREASQNEICSPRDCLWSALEWVKISRKIESSSTLEAYATALRLLDVVLALGESLTQRHERFRSDEIVTWAQDLAIPAAVWAIRHGQLECAVELLEQGRSLLLAQVGRYRAELDDLRLVDPDLAERFACLSRSLDAHIVSSQKLDKTSSAHGDPYERYRDAYAEWYRTAEEIRALPGFDTFLKPSPYVQLQKAACDGPIIILIPSTEGCAVLIIRMDAPIHHLHLPLATFERLGRLSIEFADAVNLKDGTASQMEAQCVDNLRSSWTELVGPIAHALEVDLGVPRHSRIWWCPTSWTSFLPLHAAGLYSRDQPSAIFTNIYVSSYTPTLQALIRARRPAITTAPKKLLVLSQPDTPGEAPLSLAPEEADRIVNIVSPNQDITVLSSEAGTCEAVLSRMETHSWIHFICHGVQADRESLDSYLSLYNGHLTLKKVVERNIPNADFAFLAACHSAAGDKLLADEALNLAAAMQFAGFCGVVGTLWEMADEDGPPLAEAFYREMMKHGDSSGAATALHKAIKHLRRLKVPINRWMRFVHIGI